MNKNPSKKIHRFIYSKIKYSLDPEINSHFKIFLSNLSYEQFINKIYKIKSKKEINTLKTIIIFFKTIIKKTIQFPISIKRYSFFFFKKINKNSFDIIFYLDQHPNDQRDITPVVDLCCKKKKKVGIVFKTYDSIRENEYKKIFKNVTLININNILKPTLYLEYLIFFLSNIEAYLFIKRSFKRKKFINIIKFNRYLFDFFLTKKITNKISTDKLFIDRSINKLSLIHNIKKKNPNLKIFGYALNGISFTNVSLEFKYLFNQIDLLFTYGDLDKKIINKKINKDKKFITLPKKIIPVGSARNFNFKKSIKKRNKKLNILYITSNSGILKDIDTKSLYMFIECLKKVKLDYNLYIKNRPNYQNKRLKNVSNSNLYYISDMPTEKIINQCDLIVGTFTASLIQSIYFQKITLQLNADNFFWGNFRDAKLLYANNKNQIILILETIKNRKFTSKILKKQNKFKAKYFLDKNISPKLKIYKSIFK